METKLAVFQSKEIRRTLHHGEWWFSVSDVVEALTATLNATDYIKKMRKRDSELSQGWGQIVTPLWLETEGGKQKVNCANTEGLFRIIQSIPSPKAEPFKRWLAKVGYGEIPPSPPFSKGGVTVTARLLPTKSPFEKGGFRGISI